MVKVVQELRDADPSALVCIRTTVPPGTCEALGVAVMPEFLSERAPLEDFRACENWIVGLPAVSAGARLMHEVAFHRVLLEAKAHDAIKHAELSFCSTREAELCKFFRVSLGAAKVALSNEMYEFCQATGVDHARVAQLAGFDPRITSSWLAVPGPDGKRGFGGESFPRDTRAIAEEIRSYAPCSAPIVLDAVLFRNDTRDARGN